MRFHSWFGKIPWRRDRLPIQCSWASLVVQLVKNPPAMQETRFNPCVGKIPWRIPTPVFLPGESHGQRSLVGYHPWGCKESDTTHRTEHTAQSPTSVFLGFPGGSAGKESACNTGDPGLIPGSERSPGEGIGYPLVFLGFLGGSAGKESTWNVGDLSWIPGLGRSPGEGNGSI